jgi:hypothetical protein
MTRRATAIGLICAAGLTASATATPVLEKVIHNMDATVVGGATTWATSNAFITHGTIGADGSVAFRGTMALVGGVTSSNNNLAQYGTPGALNYLARTGDTAPGLAAGQLLTSFQSATIYRSASNNQHWIGGNTSTPSGYVATGAPGSVTTVARRNDFIGPDQLMGSPNGFFPNSFNVNSSGQVLFGGTLNNNLSGPSACFVGSPGSIQEVYRTGVPYASLPTGAAIAQPSNALHNGGGNVLGGVLMAAGGTITTNNDEVLFSRAWNAAPGGFTVIGREGDPAPGCGGAVYAPTNPNVTFTNTFNFSKSNYNNAGQSVWASPLSGAGVIASTGSNATVANDVAIFFNNNGDGSQTTLFRRRNDPVASIPGAQFGMNSGNFSNLSETSRIRLNNNGDVAYNASLTVGVGGVTTANDSTLLRMSVNNASETLLAREGDAVPVLSGALWGNAFGSLQQNNPGQLAFVASLTDAGGGVITPSNNQALFAWDPTGGMQLLLQTGTDLTSMGIPMLCTSISLVSDTANAEGGSNVLSDSGWLVFRASGTALNGSGVTDSLIRTQIPAPGSTALLLAGLGVMARRRRRS